MNEVLLPGTLWNETEFQTDNGIFLSGSCGPNSLSKAMSWADQAYKGTTKVYESMRARGLCDSTGVTTLGHLYTEALDDGYAPVRLSGGWRTFFDLHVGRDAIVYLTGNGQALFDTLSNTGEDATNLKGHFITIVGFFPGGRDPVTGKDLPEGWFALDGDAWSERHLAVPNHALQFYTTQRIADSQPLDALALPRRVTISGGFQVSSIPGGWTDDAAAGVLHAPNTSCVVIKGFRDFIEARQWDSLNVPISNEYGWSDGTRQDFMFCSIAWSPTKAQPFYVPLLSEEHALLAAQAAKDAQALQASQGALQVSQAALASCQTSLKNAQDALAHALAQGVGMSDAQKAALSALSVAEAPVAAALVSLHAAADIVAALGVLASLPPLVTMLDSAVQAMLAAK